MQEYSNTAYDFSRFETKEKTAPTLKVVRNKAPKVKRRPLSLRVMLSVVLVVATLSLMIYNRVVLTELNAEVSYYAGELETLQNETARLKTQAELKLSAANIEEQAVKTLGLIKPEESQIVYVDMSQGDKVEKTGSANQGIASKLLMLLQPMLEYITD